MFACRCKNCANSEQDDGSRSKPDGQHLPNGSDSENSSPENQSSSEESEMSAVSDGEQNL